MPTLTELITPCKGPASPLLAIKASRLKEELPLLNFTEAEIEEAIYSPKMLRRLERMSAAEALLDIPDSEQAVLAAMLAHELRVIAYLCGEGTATLGIEDLLTSDLDAEVLAFEIAPKLGLMYLAESPDRFVADVEGRIWGALNRHFVALPVSKKVDGTAYMVPFLLATGTPKTIVNMDVLKKLGHAEATVPRDVSLFVNGCLVDALPAVDKCVEGINILGGDVLEKCQALVVNYRANTLRLTF